MPMDYFFTLSSVIVFVENRIQEKVNYAELEKATGFSLAHIRDIFVEKTETPLSRYILSRRVANAALEILHNQQNILNFAKPEVRQQIAILIDECKIADSKALEALKAFKSSM